ncbi:MAG: 3-dehydroquinate synthase [Deltaproteobacteria bacterium]|nr:3-dehydroquinate synthase [Deltaproteobacteria bacterium]
MDPAFVMRLPGGRSCPVYSGGYAPAAIVGAWDPAWRQGVVIGDRNTAGRFGGAIAGAIEPFVRSTLVLDFPAGETNKTRETKANLEDAMLAAGVDRDACVVAVGGGIALDVAGFVAATYLRGVAHVNVATTLLAQVDAAIGGKTGVNTPRGKNLVGAFRQPAAVFLDHAALSSLPDAEWRNGLAEAVKHAVIAGEDLFAEVEGIAASPRSLSPKLLVRLAAVKARVVEADETERGLRAVLNFGHTAGHAIEAATRHSVPHGAAVAAGMVVEAIVASRLGSFPEASVDRLRAVLRTIGLPASPPVPFALAEPWLAADKKGREGEVRCALPRRIGEMEPGDGLYTVPVPAAVLADAWERACSA